MHKPTQYLSQTYATKSEWELESKNEVYWCSTINHGSSLSSTPSFMKKVIRPTMPASTLLVSTDSSQPSLQINLPPTSTGCLTEISIGQNPQCYRYVPRRFDRNPVIGYTHSTQNSKWCTRKQGCIFLILWAPVISHLDYNDPFANTKRISDVWWAQGEKLCLSLMCSTKSGTPATHLAGYSDYTTFFDFSCWCSLQMCVCIWKGQTDKSGLNASAAVSGCLLI